MEIKIYPDSILRKQCQPLREVDDETADTLQTMLDFMYEADGVGLAGPQIGWSVRVLTLDVEQNHENPRIFINPSLHDQEGEVKEDEGCLSLPGIQAPVPRFKRLRVTAYTLHGERYEKTVEGLEARAWQHEIDHLNGILFIDRLQPTTLTGIRSQLKTLEERQC